MPHAAAATAASAAAAAVTADVALIVQSSTVHLQDDSVCTEWAVPGRKQQVCIMPCMPRMQHDARMALSPVWLQVLVLETESARASNPAILAMHQVPEDRSEDLRKALSKAVVAAPEGAKESA